MQILILLGLVLPFLLTCLSAAYLFPYRSAIIYHGDRFLRLSFILEELVVAALLCLAPVHVMFTPLPSFWAELAVFAAAPALLVLVQYQLSPVRGAVLTPPTGKVLRLSSFSRSLSGILWSFVAALPGYAVLALLWLFATSGHIG